ncbi:ATP-dependent helicase [Planctomyces sp. SH-PL14]|uniref:ATP-dependent helicase n=1 Tax=Planctomyces sp. SH-PL14 TaxID=1632864 RepID=UPI00078EDF40|nr:UvrD-helicase domain-containing protein [Planctomyces sp. SH-PL14]AMV16626.1 ATP-dependent DNA helicase PcrA [Planctomyces sp. SH-PL14]
MPLDLSLLNAAQRDAVQTLGGPVLVLAGAGTGKTRVITYRIARLVESGVPADRILSVTFTNKAAKEMLERTRHVLGGNLRKRPWISTFHALCIDILRKDITNLGYPKQFAILDRGDQEAIARQVMRDIRVTEKQMKPGDLISCIGRWKSSGIVPAKAGDAARDDKEFLGSIGYRKYQDRLRSTGSVDFDDILLLTGKLFEEFPDVLDRHQHRFSHVQIDEYQDTNGIQFELVEALVRKHKNLLVVGDDDQSIYGFRGAEVKHILSFGRHFPGAKIIRLEENYRCTDKILELANNLVAHNRDRHKKVLRANKPAKLDVRFMEYPDEQTEAEMVVRELKFYTHHKEIPQKDFAILFRTNEQPRLFEAELRRVGLRYVLVGSQSFFDRKETKDLLAYLKVLSRPRDEQSLLRIINTPVRGIGDATVEKIMTRAVKSGRGFWEVIPEAVAEGDVNPRTQKALEEFHTLLEDYRQRFDERPRQMDAHLRDLINDIGYEAEIEKQYKDPNMQMARATVIDDLVSQLTQFVARGGDPHLNEFISSLALDGIQEEPDKEKQANEDAIKMMTLHSAKGLEFPRVYMVGMEEGILPHKRSVEGAESDIAEERRLCYVGITRAQEQLTLTRCAGRKKWGKVHKAIPSRFLFEMKRNVNDLTERVEAETVEY